jgi:hypothetical protein
MNLFIEQKIKSLEPIKTEKIDSITNFIQFDFIQDSVVKVGPNH